MVPPADDAREDVRERNNIDHLAMLGCVPEVSKEGNFG